MAYERFFSPINHILTVSKEKVRQASIRGENYNVFDIIGLTTSEVKLHSAFVSDLLNPKGLHGLGTKPLRIFMELFDIHFSEDELSQAEVIQEYHIGNISDDYSRGGNIDILIRIKDYYLAIENKINSGDRPRQLLRYKNFIKSNPHKLIYLTLDGHDASEDSSCGLKAGDDYLCISYGVEMYKWLHEILMLSISRPLVRETLQQYIKVIQQLTNKEMAEVNRTELFKAMDKYPDVVRELVNNQWYYRQYLVETYIIDPLKEYFEKQGFIWYEDDSFQNQAKDSGFGIYLPGWEKQISIEFEKCDFTSGFYGVWDPKSRDCKIEPLLGCRNTPAWPYGWEYLKYKSWNISIAEDIVSGKVLQYIIDIFENLYKRIMEKPEQYPMK